MSNGIREQVGGVLKRFLTRLVFFSLMAVLSVGGCATEDDVAAIRRLIKEGVRLGEAQDIAGLIDLTTDDYEAHPGNLNRREIRRVLWLAFRHYGQFHVLHPLPKVTLESEGRSASAAVPFLIVTKETAVPGLQELYEDPRRWLEEVGKRADLYRLKLDLVKTDGNWLVRRARLETVEDMLFNG